ncbi:HTH-type transcriptional regulator CymR [Posidoniimonas corsicana]|uniref:HTH-type transcriptional regulator CymR n=1 Tax=Posidoniimonas corsicana TaxID=1938618 RepID=A0A5C5V3H0_9BACT|nr:Rrf2 family transcriptional regulator [Posidoniimonas corsicana]TWT32479.1 HTH-type transcriptional regulator CymR [Posidoniimonas corsicana]
MKLTRTAEYALSALLQLAEHPPGTPVSSHLLAREAQFPERYFLQVLRSLVTHGLLKSMRGVDGGYTLCVPLSEISLLRVIEITDGPLDSAPVQSAALPGRVLDRVNQTMAGIAAGAKSRLAMVSLADLAAEETPAALTPVSRADGADFGPEFHLPGCGCSGGVETRQTVDN